MEEMSFLSRKCKFCMYMKICLPHHYHHNNCSHNQTSKYKITLIQLTQFCSLDLLIYGVIFYVFIKDKISRKVTFCLFQKCKNIHTCIFIPHNLLYKPSPCKRESSTKTSRQTYFRQRANLSENFLLRNELKSLFFLILTFLESIILELAEAYMQVILHARQQIYYK